MIALECNHYPSRFHRCGKRPHKHEPLLAQELEVGVAVVGSTFRDHGPNGLQAHTFEPVANILHLGLSSADIRAGLHTSAWTSTKKIYVLSQVRPIPHLKAFCHCDHLSWIGVPWNSNAIMALMSFFFSKEVSNVVSLGHIPKHVQSFSTVTGNLGGTPLGTTLGSRAPTMMSPRQGSEG